MATTISCVRSLRKTQLKLLAAVAGKQGLSEVAIYDPDTEKQEFKKITDLYDIVPTKENRMLLINDKGLPMEKRGLHQSLWCIPLGTRIGHKNTYFIDSEVYKFMSMGELADKLIT